MFAKSNKSIYSWILDQPARPEQLLSSSQSTDETIENGEEKVVITKKRYEELVKQESMSNIKWMLITIK